MTGTPLVPLMQVLTDDGLPVEFAEAIRAAAPRWTASSGRIFEVAVEGASAQISLVLEVLDAPPSEEEIDADLLEFVGAVHDAVGGEWSARAVQNVARAWGWEPHAVSP
jgi:hypothetical protein